MGETTALPTEKVVLGNDDLDHLEKSTSNEVGDIQDLHLANLGLAAAQTTRNLGLMAVIAAGWAICNSWAAIAATLAISIASGGSITLIYGVILIFVLCGSCALSMAEIAAVYPTAGGQYHFTSILAPKRVSALLSYCCGALNLFGWIVTTAGFVVPMPQMITALVAFWNPDYEPHRWHVFLMYEALVVIFTLYNVFLSKHAPWFYDIGFGLSVISSFVITVACVARSSPKQSNAAVWAKFGDESATGWSNHGIIFLTGLVNPNFIYSGLDGAIHLAEECTNAAVAVPWALVSTVVIGFVTTFAFAIAMTYSYHDFEAVLASPMPILEVWHQAMRSRVAATVFLVALMLCSCFAIAGAIQTSSRLAWSFARDDALVCSHYLQRIHPRLAVPVWTLISNSVIVAILGTVYLGSTTAFNALVGTGLILQQLSFALPATLVLFCYRVYGADVLDTVLPRKTGRFRLPQALGYVANTLTMALGILAFVFYQLPATLPATGGNMNYACAVIGVCAMFSLGNWFWYARKYYHGPRLSN